MISACRDYYRGNTQVLKSIDEFEKLYTSQECIRWYTREHFIYKMINKALRTEDVQQLHTFRFFISDLSAAIANEHKKMIEAVDHAIIETVYRGSRLTLAELEEFRANLGKLISINGYLSTSCLRCVALNFIEKDLKQSDFVPVLFEIECHNEGNDCPIFADVTHISEYPDEREVLFDLGAVFKVQSVSEEESIWKICLSATNDGQVIAKQYIDETKKEMQGNSTSLLFGSLLIRMGRYQGAQVYLKQLLRDPGNENVAHIHNQLGLVDQANSEFHQAMSHFETAYQMMIELNPPLLRESAYVLLSISHVQMEQGSYEKALKYCKKAQDIFEQLSDSCELEVAHCLHTIGSSYRGQCRYSEALTYYQQALRIKQTCLPENHVHIAKTLNALGLVYLLTKDIEKAFNFFLSSLEMYQACLPEDRSDIANVLHNIADCYHSKKNLDTALQHYYLALTMKKKCYPSGHPSIATTLNNISTILSAKGEKEKALELCLEALRMRERALPFDHLELATSLSSAGHKYEAMNQNKRALEYFEKALAIRAKILPEDNPVRKRAEKNLLRMKWKT